MKSIILLLTFLPYMVFAVCDTQISRTNFSANSILTSSDLNSQFNTVYNRVNELPGDCITDGTIDPSKLDTTNFAPVLNGIYQGCKAERSDAATISIDQCYLSINGNMVSTATSETITWGCGSCSAETSSSSYYVYADETSTGSTLDLYISTTAPDNNGFNGNDKVLARFWNNASSDIEAASVVNWVVSDFEFEPVRARYTSDSGQSTSGSEVIEFEDKDYDSHSAYNISNGQYTVPVTGYYFVYASVQPTTATNSRAMTMDVDSTPVASNFLNTSGVTEDGYISITNISYLEAGDVVHIEANVGNSAISTTSYQNILTIERVR